MKILAKFLLLTTVFAAISISVGAQSNQPEKAANELPSPLTEVQIAVEKNNLLSALLPLERREAEYLASPLWRDLYLDYLGDQFNNVGEYQKAAQYEERYYADNEPRLKFRARNAADLQKSPLANYQPQSALQAIAAAGDKQQIIIVNEEHRHAVHRALIVRLLPLLYAKGFRYFALETLNEKDADLNRRGYPTVKSGSYTNNPVLGDAVRIALKLGFKLVPYEHIGCSVERSRDPMICQNERERGQAQNIYDRVLKDDPQAKILIYAGRGHAAKAAVNDGALAFMAYHLWQIGKIEPFTVNQVELSERRNPLDEPALYRLLAKQYSFTEPMVFALANGEFYSNAPKNYNLAVFTPRTEYADGRPTWLRLGGARSTHRLNLKKLNLQADKNLFRAAAPVLVQAFAANETNDAVPLDQIILRPGAKPPVLLLPKGAARVRAIDEGGKTLGEYQFKQK